MAKILGIVSMVVSALVGHWMYSQYKASTCSGAVDSFRAAYKKEYGNAQRSDIAKLLKSASMHCEAGEYDEANRLLEARATVCRLSGC